MLADAVVQGGSGWPVDLYAVAATLLDESGACDLVVSLNPRSPGANAGGHAPASDVDDVAKAWRERVAATWAKWGGETAMPVPSLDEVPDEVDKAWRVLRDWLGRTDTTTARLRKEGRDVLQAAFHIVAYADATCAGVGIGRHRPTLVATDDGVDDVLDLALAYLTANQTRSLVSPVLAPTGTVVLPKQHTPMRGLTLRSLTHHLALLPNSGVQAYWHAPTRGQVRIRDQLHVLVVPWPMVFDRMNISRRRSEEARIGSASPSFHYFSVHRTDDSGALTKLLKHLIGEAKKVADAVDMIVLPELAMTWHEFLEVRKIARDEGAVLVGGVGLPDEDGPDVERAGVDVDGLEGPANVAVIDYEGWNWRGGEKRASKGKASLSPSTILQGKHHRWCLDAPQLALYGLDSRLPRSMDHWEWIHIGPREFNLVTLEPWFTFGALICEDLARQDPMSDVVRAVGPSLLVALLLDGPQISNRWGARYATGLAEDPGTSVLTVSSLGFMELTKEYAAAQGWKDESRVIAHWRDVRQSPQEIRLGADDRAALLHVVFENHEEVTADGRSDGRAAHFPVLASWTPLRGAS